MQGPRRIRGARIVPAAGVASPHAVSPDRMTAGPGSRAPRAMLRSGVGAKPLPFPDAQQSESDEPPPESEPPVSPPGSDQEPLSPPDGSGWSQVPWSTAPWSGAVLVSQAP